MSSETAITVENLSKCYQIYDQPRERLKQFVLPRLQRLAGRPPKRYYREFWALKDVSFEVSKGETVGILGRNGSGKSTLLQIITGTLAATSGTVTTHGRIAALLELGSGFNPEFTGRENVYINASVLGLAKEEITARFDDIAAFADIGEFIDQPVKSYSSGMIVRLAFAVQAQIEPNILIVDEALAVGDAKFQAKCFERLKRLKEGGTSILLVTHSTEQVVTHCSKAVLLDNGRVCEVGDPKHAVNRYLDMLFGKPARADAQEAGEPDAEPDAGQQAEDAPAAAPLQELEYENDVFSTRPGYNPHEYRWGDGAAKITDFHLAAGGDAYPAAVSTGQRIILAIAIRFTASLHRPILGLTIKTKEGVSVYGTNSEMLDIEAFKACGAAGDAVAVQAGFACRLAPGDYFISIGVATRNGEDVIPHDRRYDAIHFQVRPEQTFFGIVNLDLDFKVDRVSA